MRTIEDYRKTSMIYWWPKTRDLPIPQPKTVMAQLTHDEINSFWSGLDGEPLDKELKARLRRAADEMGYPLFMRTDQTSGKHRYIETCYVEGPDNLFINLFRLFEDGALKDLPMDAIVFRELLDVASEFKAFMGLPIAPERRYFAQAGEILCHHGYWPPQSIHFSGATKEPDMDWEKALDTMNEQSSAEIVELTTYSRMISLALDPEDAWSIDFCKGKDGRWYMIDMALAKMSYHAEGCKNAGLLEE